LGLKDSLYPDRDSNPKLGKYEAGMLTTTLRFASIGGIGVWFFPYRDV